MNKKTTISKNQKWFIWGVAALFYLYETFLRISPSVMTHDLMRDFGVNSTSLGVLSSFYYYAYVALQIPCGIIVDKLGIRKIITCSALLCVFGTYMFATSESLMLAKLGRFMIGAGSACAFISCLKVTVEWFSPMRFSFVAGLTNMMGTFGGICAGRPLAVFVNQLGWRHASLWFAALGIVVAIIAWMFLKDHPDQRNKSADVKRPMMEGVKILAKNKQFWLVGIIGGLMYLPISAFAELWGVPFLMHAYHVNNEDASTASVMIFIGMAIGGPFAAYMLIHFKKIIRVMQFSSITAGIAFIGVAYTAFFPFWFSFVLLFLAGLFIGGQVLCFTLAKNNISECLSGTAIGFTNALVMMSGIVFQPFLGHILDVFWDGAVTGYSVPIYSTHAYQMSILTIPICLLISAIMLRFVRETHSTE
ncbi:MAG: MFS transporter [Candidatus Paracaedibacteraceae bacterium]|nr:MFS transporter [Candidatus Paracaedibacteraceae bacterium]